MIANHIQTVIFDLDGTMYDKRGLAKRMVRRLWWCLPLIIAERRARKKMHGEQYASQEDFYHAFFLRMARGHWWSPRIAEKWYHRIYLPGMVQLIGRYHHPRAEVLAIIDDCSQRGLTMAIYSDYGNVEEKLRVLGIDATQFVLLADAPSMGALKPCKASMETILARLHASPPTTLMVGDRDEKDGASARTVGAEFLKV